MFFTMPLTLYNSLTKREEIFTPIDPNHITMYVCGPTVYNYPHIGNARPAVVFDVLFRLLKATYPKMTYARNITDVDDKINKAAQEQNVPIQTITDKFTDVYHADMDALHVLRPTIEPRATDHIAEMIAMIASLIEKGHAYEAEGHVLFDVSSYDDYGALSKRPLEEMIAGARVEVAPYKKHAMDFVLWKPSEDGIVGWDSPFGYGRPGWHLECTAMIQKHLGETIDIHGGGQDLIFPHHENEIAQGTCCHDGRPYVNYWLHNGFVNVNQEKMSKSIGNVLLVNDLLNDYDGEVIRYALLSTHYRKPLDWDDTTLPRAKEALDYLYRALEIAPDIEPTRCPEVLSALEDNMNSPLAFTELSRLAKEAQKGNRDAVSQLKGGAVLLGILNHTPQEWFTRGGAEDSLSDKAIEALLTKRTEAKKRKDFAKADDIRDQLTAEGIMIEDTSDGPKWRRK